jgi:hypothetical protein
LFWIHGGGFSAGNGIAQDGYNGANFARFGDVVAAERARPGSGDRRGFAVHSPSPAVGPRQWSS